MTAKSPSRREKPQAEGYRVLLIDDDPRLVTALEDGLRLMGHQVKSSSTGTDALRLMHLLDPHVVIADLIMPEFDLLNVLEQMRKIRPSVKIVAISGNPHLLALSGKHGVDHVLAKPFDLNQLELLINILMR